MVALRDRVAARIAERVCPVCAFCGADGRCHTPDKEGCGILRNLDEIITIVREGHSDRMDPYIARLREVVCDSCRNQADDGRCPLRVGADCSLDDYFGLVVELVEEELARKE